MDTEQEMRELLSLTPFSDAVIKISVTPREDDDSGSSEDDCSIIDEEKEEQAHREYNGSILMESVSMSTMTATKGVASRTNPFALLELLFGVLAPTFRPSVLTNARTSVSFLCSAVSKAVIAPETVSVFIFIYLFLISHQNF
jgi:hypothetical protein